MKPTCIHYMGQCDHLVCPRDARQAAEQAETDARLLKPVPVYMRAPHAAHYGADHPAIGHDLESWDVIQAWDDPRPEGVPRDAERHHGYLDNQRRQHVVFWRTAPLTDKPDCVTCKLHREHGPVGAQAILNRESDERFARRGLS